MILKYVCEVCGTVENIDVNKPSDWLEIMLGDLAMMADEERKWHKVYDGYEIKICPVCVNKAMSIKEEELYDWKKIFDMVVESMKIKR